MESETVDQELRRTFKRYGFPGGSEVKASAPNAGGLGSIPGSRRSPGERNGNPFQYSCLENPMDGGAWWATVHGVAKSRTRLSDFALPYLFIIGDWNAKVGSQETSGVTGKFGLGIRNEAGQRLIVLPTEHSGHSKHPLPTTQEKTLHMDNTRWATLKSDWYSLKYQ